MANVILYSQIGHRPVIWRPIACYVLARWLEEHGYTVQVIEFTHLFSPDELVEYTKMFVDDDTKLIGVSSTMWTTWNSDLGYQSRANTVPENISGALRELKATFPNIKTIVGGPRAYDNVVGNELFDYKTTDAYGEDMLLKLLDELTDKSLATRMRRKRFEICSHRFTYKEHDCILPNEALPIEWGRGCIFKCPFCRDPHLGKKPGEDEKPVSLMVDEFTELYEKFGTTAYYFLDETFNANSDRIKDLGEVYNKLPFELEFISYNRADLLDAKPWTQEILHACGQRGTLLGIESFNPQAAKFVAKPWSAKRGKDFLLELRDKWPNTHIEVSMIAGLPFVSERELFETADWFKDSKLGFYWFLALMLFNDENKSEWEVKENEITWPNPKNPMYWEWGDMSYTRATKLAAELNRHMNTKDLWHMWSLGPLKVLGHDFKDGVNKSKTEIFNMVGDFYEHEDRLFELYKSKLRAIAGR